MKRLLMGGGFLAAMVAVAYAQEAAALRFDWTVNPMMLGTLGVTVGAFVLMNYQTKWQADRMSADLTAQEMSIKALGDKVSSLERSVALANQSLTGIGDTLKIVASQREDIARHDQRILTLEREMKEARKT